MSDRFAPGSIVVWKSDPLVRKVVSHSLELGGNHLTNCIWWDVRGRDVFTTPYGTEFLRSAVPADPLTEDAGHLVDFVVAILLGWRIHRRNTIHWVDADEDNVVGYTIRGVVNEWRPSQKNEHALPLLNLFENWCIANDGNDGVFVQLRYNGKPESYEGTAPTIPLAICRAVIAALQDSSTK